jgi:fructose-bisphosphate aldolase, class II
MIVTTAQLFKIAYGKYALGAYNINNLEQTVGLFKGNVQSKAPFIIQLSKGARKYTDKRYLEAMIRTSEQVFPEAIFAVHLDHGDEPTCYDCIDSGFYSSVMIDASHEPFKENVAITKRVVERAHGRVREVYRPKERKTRFGRTVVRDSSIFSEADLTLFPQSPDIKPAHWPSL